MNILGRAKMHVLEDIGNALRQVRQSRGLSPDDMRIVFGLESDDMVAQYIAGMAEMKAVAWLRANEAWPELAELIEESEAERALKGRQRPLDLPLPTKRRKAA
jgi:hypothetical protein